MILHSSPERERSGQVPSRDRSTGLSLGHQRISAHRIGAHQLEKARYSWESLGELSHAILFDLRRPSDSSLVVGLLLELLDLFPR